MTSSSFHGLLVIDKPAGLTSRDAVNRAQGWFPRGTRIGHTGTLDPLATGVLVLTVGAAARLAEYVQRMAKTYRTIVRLGADSDTDDADGTITSRAAARPPSRAEVDAVTREFEGEIDQVPPAYSAAKVNGRRAYQLARHGQPVSLSPRRVHVLAIDVLDYDYPLLHLEVRCSKGTYIRSLARDIGARLGCGGHVQQLRRTMVGPFRADDAINLDCDESIARGRLLPLAAATADLPRLTLPAVDLQRLRNGQRVHLPGSAGAILTTAAGQEVAILDEQNHLAAVAVLDPANRVLSPSKVMPALGEYTFPTH
jgi:tRNA pseudouridine55 synthase